VRRLRAEFYKRKDDALVGIQFGKAISSDLIADRLTFVPTLLERQLLASLDCISDIRTYPTRATAI
jgi:hypothetical protein